MDKGRVAAFTDAVVAIVLTIMVLEFKTPEEPTFAALASEWSYFVAYLISFLFIGVAWYNHHYMFALTKRVTKSLYWVNNLWILVMAMLPVSTAWAGRFIMDVQPELFYFIIFTCWTLVYAALSYTVMRVNRKRHPEVARKIRCMPAYRVHVSVWFWLVWVIVLGLIFVWPPISLLFTLADLSMMAIRTSDDSDKLF
ncbi:TMEM175 family protein [Levilactobacillus lanxiensis]|uniref:TMEM175 family protein n=1 Tax=Levilactobacillus lanxiensis TaxID=2799568 RepID=A0ABW4D4W3_9LACO|nr:TMEM175 family protein [Levilactobacillus lanxiensis]